MKGDELPVRPSQRGKSEHKLGGSSVKGRSFPTRRRSCDIPVAPASQDRDIHAPSYRNRKSEKKAGIELYALKGGG